MIAIAGSALGVVVCAAVLYFLGDEPQEPGSGHETLVRMASEWLRISGGALGVSFLNQRGNTSRGNEQHPHEANEDSRFPS